MNDIDTNHKHIYTYSFTSTINDFDIKLVSAGYNQSTKQGLLIGESCSFYECKDCGSMLITEEI